MKPSTNARRELDWTLQFWRFAMSYFLLPWVGLRSSLSMTWHRAERMNVVFRLLNLLSNWGLLAVSVLAALLLIRSLASGQWASVPALLAAMPVILAVLAIRLQAVYRLSGQHPIESVR